MIDPIASDGHSDKLLELQRQRLRQFLVAIAAAFCLIAAFNIERGLWLNTTIDLGCIAALGVSFALNERHRTVMATGTLLLTLMSVLLLLMVFNEGLFDESPLAFPGLLVFAGMFGSRRLFLVTLAAMLIILASLYVLHLQGTVLSVAEPLGPRRLAIMLSVLLVTAFFIWLLVSDLRQTWQQLQTEKRALIESHARIELMAHRDALTQLPNRTQAMKRLQEMLEQAEHQGGMTAVLFLDLDNFKTVNDSLGHSAGDELLCQVARRLLEAVRCSDTVARFSGDEFLLLLGHVRGVEDVAPIALKVMALLGQPFKLRNIDVMVTASVGIALSPRDGTAPAQLFKNADRAMYRAKETGRNNFRFFTPDMNASVLEHLQLSTSLRTAVQEGRLQLHYQPQLDLASGCVVGAEALLRWQHPTLGLVPPARFIPIAEQNGLINELGAWVLQQACRDAQHWVSQGFPQVRVSVNVSSMQFHCGTIERDIATALDDSGLPAQALELELTESLLLADTLHFAEVLHRLSARGLTIAIDDFGTGYSSLTYLRRFTAQRLKIDKSFVLGMTSNVYDEGIVRAVIEMAHCLDLDVVAEGVENPEVLARLHELGCGYGQGFHWSPALPLEEFMTWMRQRREQEPPTGMTAQRQQDGHRSHPPYHQAAA